MARKQQSNWPIIVARHQPGDDCVVIDISGICRVVPLLGQEVLPVVTREIIHLAKTLARSWLTCTFESKSETRILTISQSGEVTAGARAARKRVRTLPTTMVIPSQSRQALWQDAIESTKTTSTSVQDTASYVTWGQVTSTKESRF